MPANRKLTKIIAGRTIQSAVPAEGLLTLTLDDESVMVIKTAPGSPNTVPTGSKLLKVREAGPSLNLDLEGGGTIALTLGNPGNGVDLRDKSQKVLYLG